MLTRQELAALEPHIMAGLLLEAAQQGLLTEEQLHRLLAGLGAA